MSKNWNVINTDIPSPCLNCPDRHFKCHSECEKYKKFREKIDKARKAYQDETQRNYSIMKPKKQKHK